MAKRVRPPHSEKTKEKIRKSLERYYKKTTKSQRREKTAAARKAMAEDESKRPQSLKRYWSQFTPEERREIMSERKKLAPHDTPARIKVCRKNYKKGQGKKMLAGHKKWAEENPEILYRRGVELSATPESKNALKRGQARNRRKGQIAEAKRKRAEAVIKYQTNLNIKRVDNSVENADLINEFFGDMV